jgi:hypothetical protein
MARVHDALREEGITTKRVLVEEADYLLTVDSYNFGSILRISPKVEYEEKTTIFGTFLLDTLWTNF